MTTFTNSEVATMKGVVNAKGYRPALVSAALALVSSEQLNTTTYISMREFMETADAAGKEIDTVTLRLQDIVTKVDDAAWAVLNPDPVEYSAEQLKMKTTKELRTIAKLLGVFEGLKRSVLQTAIIAAQA